MAGLDPSALSKLRAAKNVASTTKGAVTDTKSALAPLPPGAGKEMAKDAVKDVAAGAIKGAATGGWVGAARGAAVSFIQTPAGKRVIMAVIAVSLVLNLALPLGAFILFNTGIPVTAGGDNYRSGLSVVDSGIELDVARDAVAKVQAAGVPWEIYLAVTQARKDEAVDLRKLSDALSKRQLHTIGAGAVYVNSKGLVFSTKESDKAAAKAEEEAYVAALREYGLSETEAPRVFKQALAWRLGEVSRCTATETKNSDDKQTASETPKPATAAATVNDNDPRTVDDSNGIILEVPGRKYHLSAAQVRNIKDIAAAAKDVPGVTEDALTIAFMAAMTESSLLNYANSNVPSSLTFPHDAVGSDHDSVGFWQFRADDGGWGPVDKLMTIPYQVKIFFGGPTKPETSRKPGLFDIDGWDKMTKAEAAQAFEVSAFPDRYAEHEAFAVELVKRYGAGTANSCDGGKNIAGEAGHPLGDPNIPINSGFGGRESPGGIGSSDHKGIDFQVGCDHPIYAVADGTVVWAGELGGWGNMVAIDHGNGFITRYAHMPWEAKQPAEGSKVKKGEQIGVVGTTGASTGCHLHLETLIDGVQHDPYVVLTGMGVKLVWLSEM